MCGHCAGLGCLCGRGACEEQQLQVGVQGRVEGLCALLLQWQQRQPPQQQQRQQWLMLSVWSAYGCCTGQLVVAVASPPQWEGVAVHDVAVGSHLL